MSSNRGELDSIDLAVVAEEGGRGGGRGGLARRGGGDVSRWWL